MSPPIVEKISDPVRLGEGPHWDAERKVLYFVDIEGFSVYKYDPSTQALKSVNFDEEVSLVIPVKDEKDKFIISLRRKVVLVTWDGETNKPTKLEVIASVDNEEGKETNRLNDGKADASGRLWAGTMAMKVNNQIIMDRGIFFSLTKDRKTITHQKIVSISNGLTWSLDNKIMYYIDSPTNRIDAFDFDITEGKISNRRPVFDLAANGIEGSPDGQTIDTDGNLWVACYGGKQVIQVNPTTGKLLQRVDIPALNVTSVAWGGNQLDELFVTTAFDGMSQEELDRYPMSGCTFRVTGLGSRGFPGQPVVL